MHGSPCSLLPNQHGQLHGPAASTLAPSSDNPTILRRIEINEHILSPAYGGVDVRAPAPRDEVHGGLDHCLAERSLLGRELQSVACRVHAYWVSLDEAVSKAARAAYECEMAHARGDTVQTELQRIRQSFLSLPVDGPFQPTQFGVTDRDVIETELALLRTRCSELGVCSGAIETAWTTPLDISALCPFPLAVACRFLESAGVAPEFLYAYFYSFGGWVQHEDVHALFEPQRRNRRTRPRVFSQVIAAPSSSKSPFYRCFVSSFLVGVDTEQAVLTSHQQLFSPGGKQKASISRLRLIQILHSGCMTQACMSSGRLQKTTSYWIMPTRAVTQTHPLEK